MNNKTFYLLGHASEYDTMELQLGEIILNQNTRTTQTSFQTITFIIKENVAIKWFDKLLMAGR